MSENKSSVKWAKVLAIVLCVVIGVLANMSTDLQKAWLGRTVIGGPMLALLVSMIVCNIVPSKNLCLKRLRGREGIRK